MANTSTKSLLKSSLKNQLNKWNCIGLIIKLNLSPQKSELIKYLHWNTKTCKPNNSRHNQSLKTQSLRISFFLTLKLNWMCRNPSFKWVRCQLLWPRMLKKPSKWQKEQCSCSKMTNKSWMRRPRNSPMFGLGWRASVEWMNLSKGSRAVPAVMEMSLTVQIYHQRLSCMMNKVRCRFNTLCENQVFSHRKILQKAIKKFRQW